MQNGQRSPPLPVELTNGMERRRDPPLPVEITNGMERRSDKFSLPAASSGGR